MLCHLKFVSIYLSRYPCYPFGQTKRQWIFLSPKFLVFWTGNVYQDISLLVVVFNVEKNNGSFCHLDFFSLKISRCWYGVVFKTRGGFLCFEFVFQDICLLSVVFKTRKGFLLFCFVFQYISLSVWCSKPEEAFCYHFPPLETNPYFCQLMAL